MNIHPRLSRPSSFVIRQSKKAFTLMEMMLVLAIIAILIGIGANMMGGADEIAKQVAAKAGISTIKSALMGYKAVNGGRLPGMAASGQGLEVLTKSNKGGRSYMNPEGIIDPWGHTYKFANPGRKSNDGYDLWSVGPDGTDGSEDDIGNWSEKQK